MAAQVIKIEDNSNKVVKPNTNTYKTTTTGIVTNTPEKISSLNVSKGTTVATPTGSKTYNPGYGTNTSGQFNQNAINNYVAPTTTPTQPEGGNGGNGGSGGNGGGSNTPTAKDTTPTTTTTKSSGGSSGGSSSYNAYSMIQSMYDAKRQQAIAEIQRAMEKAIAGYQNSIDTLDQSYQPLRNQSEVERYKSEQALKEQLANGGNMYSGMGRQDQLNLQNAYSNAITNINNQQQNELDTLNKAILDAKQEGEYQKANAGYNYDIANYQAMLNQYNTDRQYEWQQYLQQYQEGQDALKNMYNYGATSASNVTPKSSSTSSSASSNSVSKYGLDSVLQNGQAYSGFADDLASYVASYGKYPSTKSTEAASKKIDEYVSKNNATKNDIANYIVSLMYANEINDVEAYTLTQEYGIPQNVVENYITLWKARYNK